MPGELVPFLPELARQEKETPYDVFLALCEVTGNEPKNAPATYVKQQLGIAKRLLREGYRVEEIRQCLCWVLGRFRSSVVDLRLVQREIGGWAFAGKPAHPDARGPLSARSILDAARQLRSAGD
jgi:hypothetical protein